MNEGVPPRSRYAYSLTWLVHSCDFESIKLLIASHVALSMGTCSAGEAYGSIKGLG